MRRDTTGYLLNKNLRGVEGNRVYGSTTHKKDANLLQMMRKTETETERSPLIEVIVMWPEYEANRFSLLPA